MNILEKMRAEAFAEFDALVDQRERDFRAAMEAEKRPAVEIDAILARTRQGMDSYRALIGSQVAIGLMKQGVPLDMEAVEWRG